MRGLERLGLFAGWRRDTNCEALLFQGLNDWLFRAADATWFRPEPVRAALRDGALRGAALARIDAALVGWPRLGYLGPRRFASSRESLRSCLSAPWGWKDPRNTFTLPVWLELFPSARVIGVERHGVDAAASLVRRERARPTLGKPPRVSILGLTPNSLAAPLPGYDLPQAFALWETYAGAATEVKSRAGDSFLSARYEDFTREPLRVLPEIARFCGIEPGASALRHAAGALLGSGAFRHTQDPELIDFAASVSPRLARFGY